jgi:FkbM family methyltransferase
MEFSKTLAAHCSDKQNEISQRSLMGFPVDSAQDKLNQEHLAREIADLKGVRTYDSPTTGLRLPIDQRFPTNMLYYFLIGDYEEHDMRLISRYVKPGSRVLELGGGIGLTGSLLGKVTGTTVYICEPNAALHPQIERTLEANKIPFKLFKSAVTSDQETAREVTLHVCKDYWWSSLVGAENSVPMQVPAKKLSTLIDETRADTLLVDIEGYEVALFSNAKCLASIRMILIEIHTPSIGSIASSSIINTLVKAGFDLIDFGGHTWVFARPETRRMQPGPHGPLY